MAKRKHRPDSDVIDEAIRRLSENGESFERRVQEALKWVRWRSTTRASHLTPITDTAELRAVYLAMKERERGSGSTPAKERAFAFKRSRPGRVIDALKRMTVANGCTPAEAAAARAKLIEMGVSR